MADPVKFAQRPAPTKTESESFFDHIKNFFASGPGKDPKKSEIVGKGGPGGQARENHLMDAVDRAVTGATDDE